MTSQRLPSPRHPGAVARLVKASVWLVAALAVAAYLLVEGIHTFKIMWAGAETTARVVQTSEHEVEDDRGRAGTITTVDYEFFVDRGRFTGETSAGGASWIDDERIRVLDNPRNPAQNRGKGDRGFLEGLFFKLLFGGLFIYWAVSNHLPELLHVFRLPQQAECNQGERDQDELDYINAEIERMRAEARMGRRELRPESKPPENLQR